MPYRSLRGFVLGSSVRRESDRLIHILTREGEVVVASVPGAAKSGSRFALASQPGILCDYVLTLSHDFYYVKEAEVIEAFRNIREDIERLTAAAHILEITKDISVDSVASEEIYPLLGHALARLNRLDSDYRLIVSVFEWRAAAIAGFSPDLSDCDCGEEKPGQAGAFSYDNCRLYCCKSACLTRAGNSIFLSYGAMSALRYIDASPVEKIFSFSVSAKVLDEIRRLTRSYLSQRLEKNYSKMDLLQDIPVWNPAETDSVTQNPPDLSP